MGAIETYQAAVEECALAGNVLCVTIKDLPALIAACERAEATGPLLDPTLYREKVKAMREDLELFRAALPLWTLAKKRREVARGG
jgi:hypothetical protein